MKRINTSAIPVGLGAPIKTGTQEFMFDSHKETVATLLKAALQGTYAINTPYIIYGVDFSYTFPTYSHTAGAIFMNDEIFLVDAENQTTGAWVGCKIVTTQYTTNADPVTLSDGSTTANLHDIRKISIGATGTFTLPLPINSPLKISSDTNSSLSVDVYFKNNTGTKLTHAAGALYLNLYDTGAVVGTKQIFYWTGLASSASFSINIIAGGTAIYKTSTFTGSAPVLIEIEYAIIGGTKYFIINQFGW